MITQPPPSPVDPAGMAYDLRARYAQIVGDILEEIAVFRNKRNFPKWFSLLEDLHIEINQKLSADEKKDYAAELKTCIDILNTNKAAYIGTSQDGKTRYLVYTAIKNLEIWLREKMEKNKMFGGKGDAENM